MVEFESDLIKMRTREGIEVARAKGRLRGKQPKLSARQEAHLVVLPAAGGHTISELEELFFGSASGGPDPVGGHEGGSGFGDNVRRGYRE